MSDGRDHIEQERDGGEEWWSYDVVLSQTRTRHVPSSSYKRPQRRLETIYRGEGEGSEVLLGVADRPSPSPLTFLVFFVTPNHPGVPPCGQ